MPEGELDEKLARAIERLDRLVGSVENDPDPAFRERVFELLESIDAVHRPLVWRVGELAYHDHPEFFEERLLHDPLAAILFEMYGLVATKGRADATAEAPATSAAMISLTDLEASIPPPLGWYVAARDDEVVAGAILGRDVEGERLLLGRVEGEIHAYRDLCPGTPMPLSSGVVRDGTLFCPWHDCRFDLRSGRRADRAAEPLAAIPVTVRDGEVRVGLRVKKRSVA